MALKVIKRIQFFFLVTIFLFGFLQDFVCQESNDGKHIPGAPCKNYKKNIALERNGDGKVLNGNGNIATSYTTQATGLNYTIGSVVIEQRSIGVSSSLPPPGILQPAPIIISGIPAVATILKAFLYCDASGNGIPITATLTNPGGGSGNFPMTIIGQDVDKCWGGIGFSATYSYRADVTSIVSSNGTYSVSGLPVHPPDTSNDVDGASLFIIYKDTTQSFMGAIVLADGAHVSTGLSIADNISGFDVNFVNTNAAAFILISDLQKIGNTALSLNGSADTLFTASDDWWNFLSSPTTVSMGQTVSAFTVANSGDCFNVVIEGLYFHNCCISTNSINIVDKNEFKVFPSPFLEKICVSMAELEQIKEVVFYNSMGEVVKRGKFNSSFCEINTAEFPNGSYVLLIITNQNVYSRKIIKN